eukprot:TRINITY_DN27047_c0_g1_i1.p1 TRINITY_DN27047_c0_g1~~TRINITY_DN27047_c0_g1_i1.p1  ORF type:complete len:275 (+),score=38.12 TRINITY_DN27047_c0_g1_i1:89-826(+)
MEPVAASPDRKRKRIHAQDVKIACTEIDICAGDRTNVRLQNEKLCKDSGTMSLPAASDQEMPCAPSTAVFSELSARGDKVLGNFLGFVRKVDAGKGCAFSVSDELRAATGIKSDCFVHLHQLGPGILPGAAVLFTAFLGGRSGRPRARDVICAGDQCPPASGRQGDTAAVAGEGVLLGAYLGTIKAFNAIRGSGFITCPHLNHGGDVFFHHKKRSLFQTEPALQVGGMVWFEAIVCQGAKPAHEI